MMKFFTFLFLLGLSLWLGTKITTNPGYLLITWEKTALEMPLWVGFLVLATSFILFYFLIRGFNILFSLPTYWRHYQLKKQQRKQKLLENQRLFSALYQKPKNWQEILNLLPNLEKKWGLSSCQLRSLQQKTYNGLLSEASSLSALETLWNRLPSRLKLDPVLVNTYAQALIKHQQESRAELLLIKQLKTQWFGPLTSTYSLINSSHPERQLEIAEKWLKKHPDDPYLLLALGRLCRKRRLWGKARDYLEKSLSYKEVAQAAIYEELGNFYEALGEPTQALIWFKKGLVKTITNEVNKTYPLL